MKHVVAHAEGGQIKMATVDDETGELVQFGQMLWPEGFGLHESAVLSTNLTSFLQLDKPAGRNGRNGHSKALPPRDQPNLFSELPAAPETEPKTSAPPGETAKQRRNRLAREKYARTHAEPAKKKRGRPPGPSYTTKGGAEWFVTPESIVDLVAHYPEGIRTTEIAALLWRLSGQDNDDYPGWLYQSVNNRLLIMRQKAKAGKAPMPLREEDRPIPDKSGQYNGATGKFLMPLPLATPAPDLS